MGNIAKSVFYYFIRKTFNKLPVISYFYFILSYSLCNIVFAHNIIEIDLEIINHKFIPNEITVEAGKKIRLIVHNKDETVEEFESIDLKREKIIPGGTIAHIVLAPLKPGIYEFEGEFHADTAQGKIIAILKEENKEENIE